MDGCGVNMICHECDTLPSHLAEICNGSMIVDGKPVDASYVTLFRSRFGLPPIGQWNGEVCSYPLTHDSEITVPEKPKESFHADVVQQEEMAASLGPNPGTNLASLLKACGIKVKDGCGCEEWIGKMNAWSIEENLAHQDEIAERLRERAKLENMTITQKAKIGMMLVLKGAMPTVRGLILHAISVAQKARAVKDSP